MELIPMHRLVVVLDVPQAKITACAIVEHDDGRVEFSVACRGLESLASHSEPKELDSPCSR